MAHPRKPLVPRGGLKVVPSPREVVPSRREESDGKSPSFPGNTPASVVLDAAVLAPALLDAPIADARIFPPPSEPAPEAVGKLGSRTPEALVADFLSTSRELTKRERAGKQSLMIENAGELVSLGADIVRLGAELKMARADAEESLLLVKKLEGELQPKLIRHAQLIQEAAGVSFAVPVPVQAPIQLDQPVGPPLPEWAPAAARLDSLPETASSPATVAAARPALPPNPLNPNTQLKNRVKDYLKKRQADESISASEVAEYLHIDALIVREAMRELRTGR